MSITPDLKDDEFEITFTCPVAGCLVQTTYAFNNELKTFPAKEIKQVKDKMIENQTKYHMDGKHTAEKAAA